MCRGIVANAIMYLNVETKTEIGNADTDAVLYCADRRTVPYF